ncbi:cytochrome P450 71AP13-like [Humulus lupulus]|uniref:cytochrome P450 71AP13-like n=1 Tax=Humulus lupulus TaxID=3486 RepID=UPI002B40AF38|nr:cytochrome P450 71AP13-like [Humulus lupulus]
MTLLEYLREPTFQISSILFLAIFLKYFIFKKKPTQKQGFNLPPSPPKLPIIGNLHQFGTTAPHISLRNLSRKYGPIFYLKLGHIPTVIISSAKLAKEAFKIHDLSFASRPRVIAAEYLFYKCTDMVFSPYGAYWRYIRKVCILEVLSAKRVHSFKFVREEEVVRLVRRLSEPYPATVNMSKMLGLYANDVLCRAAFGRDFSEGGDYDRQGFQEMLEEYQELLGGLSFGDFFPSMDFVLTLTGMKSRLVRTFKRFDQLFDRIIAEHLDPKRVTEDTKDIVDVLLDIQKGSGEMPVTMDNVKALILDMFAAGTDTTFIVLDWAMTELIINPKALEEAQAELQSVLGERKVVLESDLSELNYMKAIIKETFRLHPPAPVLVPRESLEHVTMEGYDIPVKTRIFVNAWAIGRDPETWEDPDTFKPERFLNSSIDFRDQDYELIPFGAGRRVCPAITFGTAVVEIALAQLLHSFDWELPTGVTPKDLDMTEVFGITMHRKVGLEVLAKPRFS